MARETPPIYIRRTARGIEAASQYDADLLAAKIQIGGEVEISLKKARRSLPQLRLYWKMLARVVTATGRFPTPEHLHDELKMHMGYSERRTSFDGRIYYRADSAAFEKMDGAEFKVFFDRAVEVLAGEFGFDPLAFYDERKAA